MAQCSTCGKPVHFFSGLCSDCKAEQQKREREERARLAAAEAERQREQETAEAELKRQAEARAWGVATERADALRQRVAHGRRVFLYESIYVPVDSKLDGEDVCSTFDIDSLR